MPYQSMGIILTPSCRFADFSALGGGWRYHCYRRVTVLKCYCSRIIINIIKTCLDIDILITAMIMATLPPLHYPLMHAIRRFHFGLGQNASIDFFDIFFALSQFMGYFDICRFDDRYSQSIHRKRRAKML